MKRIIIYLRHADDLGFGLLRITTPDETFLFHHKKNELYKRCSLVPLNWTGAGETDIAGFLKRFLPDEMLEKVRLDLIPDTIEECDRRLAEYVRIMRFFKMGIWQGILIVIVMAGCSIFVMASIARRVPWELISPGVVAAFIVDLVLSSMPMVVGAAIPMIFRFKMLETDKIMKDINQRRQVLQYNASHVK